ncbi:MAG: hypothetical protein LBC94_05585 [Desulfovibrio sp.]|jgi:hypothetical protein|nr:hypothetical protein [Desulfovibrio sp.]
MSLSSFLISPPGAHSTGAGKAAPVSSAVALRPPRSGASFAAVMAEKKQRRQAEDAAGLPGKSVDGNAGFIQESAARLEMRRSHLTWSPEGIPLAGNRNNVSPRPGNGLNTGESPGFALKTDDFIRTRSGAVKKATESNKPAPTAESGEIGRLSARFESGSEGIAAIGYDGTGGTSYGKYQIASRVGGMKDFLKFLDERAPDIADRLRRGGPADTGGRKGRMPDIWRNIAREEPERFERLQEGFIHESHYKPALAAIVERTRLEEGNLSPVMREVIWSTAVQHGPAGAARLFDRADDMSGKGVGSAYERQLISNVYALRVGQFGSSTKEIQDSVARRFVREKMLALNMLDAGGATHALA